MADKLKDLPDFYKNVNTPELKNAWIKILQDNPTTAIDAYHKALCKENEKNGWCGLMNLFRILGALEQANNEKQNPMLTRQISSSSVQSDGPEETKTDLNEEHDRDLNNINDALIELKKKIGNMSSKNKQFSSVDHTKESQSRQPEMGDTNKQIEELKDQIQQLNNEYNQSEHEKKLNEEKATKEQKEQQIYKLNKYIDDFKKNHEEEVKKLQETISQLEQSNQQNNATQDEIEKIKKNIEKLNTSNQEKIEELQNDYKIKLEEEKSKMKEQVELWKNESKNIDDEDYMEGGNTNKNLKPGNAPKPKTKETIKKQLKSLEANVGSNINAIEAKIDDNKEKSVVINFTTCGDGNKMNEEFAKKMFSLYEKAKEILHGDMLILVGCLHFHKLNLLGNITETNKEVLNKIEESLFIQLTKDEYNRINEKIELLSKSSSKLKPIFDKICNRDNKYKKEDIHQSIMVYALLWIFHYNTTLTIKDSESTYQQILSNKSLFSTQTKFITTKNCEVISSIGKKIQDSITILEEIKNTVIGDEQNAEFIDLRQQYIDVVQNNKSVLALLKRRDDWNNEKTENTTGGKKHQRFKMETPNENNTIFEPLTLKYNDTPLEIAEEQEEDEEGEGVLDKMMTHHYTFYGFDAVFEPSLGNADIATRLSSDFIKDDRPLCFIGYGQSGSGKTSTLIYLDVENMEEDGILIELLKKINPETVTVSMIEIYQAEAATEADESCIGIGTTENSKPEEILPCYPIKNGVQEKPRQRIPYVPMEYEPNTSMRYVTIGEVLDKQFDDKTKGKKRNKQDIDGQTQTTFKKGTYSNCAKKDAGKDGWLYTHGNEPTVECLDKNFGLKHYVLMGFECREIAPTSNNKQSSRSHVVVSLELNHPNWGGKSRSIYVCDLAGVENVFDCNPGSTDMIRMKAKTKANKNYSNNVGNGNIEDWNSLNKKRTGNIVKYIHKDIHIASSTPTTPNCWPDGNANESGDIGEIAENFSKELMQIFYYDAIKGENKMIGKVKQHGGGGDVNANSVFKYFKNKLEKLPLKKVNGKIIGITDVENNIKEFFRLASYSSGKGYGFKAFLKGEKYNGTEITTEMINNINWDEWSKGENESAYRKMEGVSSTVDTVKKVFNKLQAPDCNSSYESGFKKACDIRVKEGYIINNTLAQLTKDVKRISKFAIKERLEYETPPQTGKEGVKREAGYYPCLYADTYDEYTYYSKTTNPLMDWYDIDDPLKEDFGSILSAMCLLKEQNIKKWTISEKLNFLKQFRFNYCTVLNETYIMNFGGEEAKTPAGNLIYVNNPPLPPFINVGILENSYKEFIFYENDPNDYKNETESKKYKAFLNLYNNFLNLVVKMFKHPLYEQEAVLVMQRLGDITSQNPKLIFFKNNEDLAKNFKNKSIISYLKINSKKLINLIKNNNNATFIGTIQTTEEVNRVSQKIILSKAVNQEEKLSSIDATNLNTEILKKLFVSCYLRKNKGKSTFFKGEGTVGGIRRFFETENKQLSAILYECLYEINKLYDYNGYLKPCKTMKERDIDGMLNAIETVFPIMTRYIDPLKLQSVWEKISSLERGNSVIVNKNIGMYAEIDKKSYPYERDLTINGSKGLWEAKIYTKEQFENIFITDKIKKSGTPLLDFNKILTNVLKNEPSIPFITNDVWEEERKNTNWGYAYELTKSGPGYPTLGEFHTAVGFKEKKHKKETIMPYLTTKDFFNAVYGAYIGKTFEEPNKWDRGKKSKFNSVPASFVSFKAIKPSTVKKYISNNDNLSIKGIDTSYPPDDFSDIGDDWSGGGGNNVTSDKIVKTINEIGESIGNLGGINQQQPSQNEISNEDLERLKKAIGELQNHIIDNMKEINKGITEVDTRAKEALDQIKEKKNEMQFNDLKMK